MASCAACQFENPEGARFCGGCGERLDTRPCPACETPNPRHHRFCSECGAVLDAAAAATSRSPAAYTPRHLAERILTQRSALEGERKRITVLFADVRESTALAHELDPEVWHGILDRFFEILTEGVHRFEGTINQYTGDGIMALFGAPLAHEDHAQRACHAALWLRDALRAYADELRRQGHNLSVRIGLNSGEVVVGKIGDDLRMDYTAQGHTVSLAQRAESLAEAGHVLLTESTASAVEGYFALRSLGPTQLRGVPEPVELFELEGLGPLRTRLDASRAVGFTRFVGRTAELAQLDAALDRALEGDATVVGVVGEAGVGKSRLCDAFVGRARARGVRVYQTGCPSHTRTLSGVATRELVRSFFGVEASDSAEVGRRKIAGTLVLLDEGFRDAMPLVFEVAGVAESGSQSAVQDESTRRRRLNAFLRELTIKRSEREPAILFYDDAHWIDPESDVDLTDLIAATRGTRTLVLANFRPEYQAGWMSDPRYQQIALRPLGRAESEALLDALLGRDASLAPVRRQILERAGGNPFFVEELAKSLRETGVVVGERGAGRLAGDVGALAVPESVEAVLAARIDARPESEKRLLQTASLVGRDFALPVLEAAAELPADEVRTALDRLVQAELVHEVHLYPQAEYRFNHALTREVADKGQLSEARRAGHGRIARVLEAFHADGDDQHAGEVALHFEQAGEPGRAARWYERAALAPGSRISATAGRYWDEVLRCTEAAEDEETLRLRLRAVGGSLFGRWAAVETDVEDDERCYREGVGLAQRLGDRNAEILLESAYALLVFASGHPERQIGHLERALGLVNEATPRDLHVSILQRVAWTHSWYGDVARAVEYGREGLALGNHDPGSDPRLLGYNAIIALQSSLGHGLYQQGHLAEGREALERALAMARDHPDPLVLDICHWNLADLEHFQGDAGRALAHLDAADRATETLDSEAWHLPTALRRVLFRTDDHDWEGASAAAEAIDWLIGDAADYGPHLVIRTFAALTDLRLRPDDGVRARAAELLASPLHTDDHHLMLRVRAQLAEALGESGERVATLLDECEEVIRRRGSKTDRSFLLFDRAELAHRRGDTVERDRRIAEAIELAGRLGAEARAALYERRGESWRAEDRASAP